MSEGSNVHSSTTCIVPGVAVVPMDPFVAIAKQFAVLSAGRSVAKYCAPEPDDETPAMGVGGSTEEKTFAQDAEVKLIPVLGGA